jgi:hypothetical protein
MKIILGLIIISIIALSGCTQKCIEKQVPYEEQETYTESVPKVIEECYERQPRYSMEKISDMLPPDNMITRLKICNLDVDKIEGFLISYRICIRGECNAIKVDMNLEPGECKEEGYIGAPIVQVEIKDITFSNYNPSNFKECRDKTIYEDMERTKTITKYRTETMCD